MATASTGEMRRSVTLWSGLLVLAYLVWAWWDSGRYCSYAEYSRPAWTLSIFGYDATLRCALNTAPDAMIRPGFNIGHDDFGTWGRMQNLDLKPGACYFDFEGPYREVRLAAWIVIMLFVNVWVLLLLWSYVRRRKREAAMQPPQEAEGEHLLLSSLYQPHASAPPDSGDQDEMHR